MKYTSSLVIIIFIASGARHKLTIDDERCKEKGFRREFGKYMNLWDNDENEQVPQQAEIWWRGARQKRRLAESSTLLS